MNDSSERVARVPLLDLAAQHSPIQAELCAAVERVLASGRYILGPEVAAFEQEVAEYLGARHAIGVSSGTDALSCALMSLDIGPGDEVITSNFSFVAAAESVARLQAVPRLVDIRPDTFNLDPEAVARAIGPRTRAVIAVHLFGHPADLRELAALCAGRGIHLIEDAAQAFGAALDGRKLGTWGAAGCFSFFPSKPLGALGDGGLIVTNDDALAARCRRVRAHGASGKYAHQELGGNFRLDEIQAAVLRVKLPWVGRWAEARRRHAEAYSAALAHAPGITLPATPPGSESVWSSFTLRATAPGGRDALARLLAAHGIDSAIHYPSPLSAQPALHAAPRDPTPHAERAAREVLSIPLFPTLSEPARQRVIDRVSAAARGELVI